MNYSFKPISCQCNTLYSFTIMSNAICHFMGYKQNVYYNFLQLLDKVRYLGYYLRHIIVLFVETPRKFITAKLSMCKPGSSSVLIISANNNIIYVVFPQTKLLYVLSPCKHTNNLLHKTCLEVATWVRLYWIWFVNFVYKIIPYVYYI
jgi:hypothetical protein